MQNDLCCSQEIVHYPIWLTAFTATVGTLNQDTPAAGSASGLDITPAITYHDTLL
jgi:hypothetical protein